MSEKAIDRHAAHKENGSLEEFKDTEHVLEVDNKVEERILRKCDCESAGTLLYSGEKLTVTQITYFLGYSVSGFAHSSTGRISAMPR